MQDRPESELYTKEGLYAAISENSGFLTQAKLNKLSLQELKDGTNHLLVTVGVDHDWADVKNVVIHLMSLPGWRLDYLYKVTKNKSKDYAGYTVATLAAGSLNQSLSTIIDGMMDSIGKAELDGALRKFANFSVGANPKNRWNGFHMIHFSAKEGLVDHLKLLESCGADLSAELPKGTKTKSWGKCGGWNVQDIAIKQWTRYDEDAVKSSYLDIIKYFVPYLKKTLSLAEIQEDIATKHNYLTKEQMIEINEIVQLAYEKDFSATPSILESHRGKRRDRHDSEPVRKSKRRKGEGSKILDESKQKIESESPKPSTNSSHASMSAAFHSSSHSVASAPEVDAKSECNAFKNEMETFWDAFDEHKKQTEGQVKSLQAELTESRLNFAKLNAEFKKIQSLATDFGAFQARLAALDSIPAQLTLLEQGRAQTDIEMKEAKSDLTKLQTKVAEQGEQIGFFRPPQFSDEMNRVKGDLSKLTEKLDGHVELANTRYSLFNSKFNELMLQKALAAAEARKSPDTAPPRSFSPTSLLTDP